MGCKPSKSGGSSRWQSCQPPDFQPAVNVDRGKAPPPSSQHHHVNCSRENSDAPLSTNDGSNSLIVLQMKSYEKACKEIPEIQSFHETIRSQAEETISAIASDANNKAISLASLGKAADYVFYMEAETVNRILQSKEDIYKHPELKALVEDYFDSSDKTLKFCLDLKKCVMNARNKQMMSIKLAVKRFEEEAAVDVAGQSSDGIGQEKFKKTLEELRRFTELGEPFTMEFFRVFRSVLDQQRLMLDKLTARGNTLRKNKKRIKSWKKVSGIIFVSTFTVALISTVVAAALTAPPAVAALAGAATSAIGFAPLEKWFQSVWKRYENPVENELGMINKMEEDTEAIIDELKIIGILVDRLTNDAQALLGTARFVLRYDDAVRIGIKDIQQKLNEFEEWINELEFRAETCGKYVRESRAAIVQKVKNYSK